jgi:hypothetical protein
MKSEVLLQRSQRPATGRYPNREDFCSHNNGVNQSAVVLYTIRRLAYCQRKLLVSDQLHASAVSSPKKTPIPIKSETL